MWGDKKAMKSPNLNEATIQDICEELSKRNVNFAFVASYYEVREEDQQPFISFGIRPQDVLKTIGMLETAKSTLINEFNQDKEELGYYEDEDEDKDNEE